VKFTRKRSTVGRLSKDQCTKNRLRAMEARREALKPGLGVGRAMCNSVPSQLCAELV
jgi:hypothetical protein